jgi:NACalpha-BTF3-like transcription factor
MLQVDELDASGTIKNSVQGDLGAIRSSSSLPASGEAATRSTVATPSTVAAPTASPGGEPAVDQEKVQQIQNLTGAAREQCIEALKASGGNADAAVSMLLGL